MKTKKDIFLEDIANANKDAMKNILLIPPRDMERKGYFATVLYSTIIGGSIGTYLTSQDGDWKKAGIGTFLGFVYGMFSPLGALFIRDMKGSIKDYISSLEERAKIELK